MAIIHFAGIGDNLSDKTWIFKNCLTVTDEDGRKSALNLIKGDRQLIRNAPYMLNILWALCKTHFTMSLEKETITREKMVENNNAISGILIKALMNIGIAPDDFEDFRNFAEILAECYNEEILGCREKT